MTPSDLTLRLADPGDAEEVARLHLAARTAAYPSMPASVHPDAEVLAHVAGLVRSGGPECSGGPACSGGPELETWVAQDADGALLGYAMLTATWLDALYVDPAHQGRGVGSALLELVVALRPGGFGLWVFTSNAPARSFYRRHGLVEVEETDGHDNEERQPDVRMAWRGDAPTPGA